MNIPPLDIPDAKEQMRQFAALPASHTARGQLRRVGVEIEYGELNLDRAAELIRQVFGGVVRSPNQFERRVDGEFGEFKVEIDTSILKQKKYKPFFMRLGVSAKQAESAGFKDFLLSIFKKIVPFEIVTPPLPPAALPLTDVLREKLRLGGALGTSAKARYAFGLHFNPTARSEDVAEFLSVLQAFLVLYPEIMKKRPPDATRKIAHYINPFPFSFADHILQPAYRPSRRMLIADYLHFNPTRNRPLDMLPLFSCFERGMIERTLGSEAMLVSTRPAYHYRLPNSYVDRREWSIAAEWATWVAIEQLAQDSARLRVLADRYREDLAGSGAALKDRIVHAFN